MSKQNVDISKYLELPSQEAFKVLSTNLRLNKKNEKLKIISIISYYPSEGKTCVAINLAIEAARSGNSVVYVDADLRKPIEPQYYLDGSTKGITDLSEDIKIEDVICNTSIDELKHVTKGHKRVDPVKFLSSQIFDDFLVMISHQFDMVIIDTPSIGNYVDGAIIASKSSGALIIIRANQTLYKNIERIKCKLENVGANIIGIVNNRVNLHDYKSDFY